MLFLTLLRKKFDELHVEIEKAGVAIQSLIDGKQGVTVWGFDPYGSRLSASQIAAVGR